MHRIIGVILALAMIFSLSACAGTPQAASEAPTPAPTTEPTAAPTEAPTAEPTESAATEPTEEPEAGERVLIAYFTWAENTYVEDPSAVDADATTSASVLLPGNAAKLAGWIQDEVGGDLFSIVVTEPYSSNYDECLDRAADEKAANARPALVNHVENMEDYDIVFLGFPNWWYTVPMAIHTFLEEYDFSGKTIVPFVTHGTGGLSTTIQDITADLPDDVEILEPIGVYRPTVNDAQPEIEAWIASLDLDI